MSAVTAKRERKFKRAKLRTVNLDFANLYDSDYVMALAAECAYEAVSEMFAWLSVDQIRTPPRTMKDAQLGRQAAIYLMATVLQMPQRQIARLQGRQRTNIHFALRAVEKRLEADTFFNEFAIAEARAEQLLSEALDAANAAQNNDSFTSIAA